MTEQGRGSMGMIELEVAFALDGLINILAD